jgi:hypothetical protein
VDSRKPGLGRLHCILIRRRLEASDSLGMLGLRNSDGDHSMNTGLSLEERLQIIHEVLLVVEENAKVRGAASPKMDLFWILRAIHQDGAPYRCTTRQILVAALRKSPVWMKVKPFLQYAERICARKGCHCDASQHQDNTGKCGGYHYVGQWSNGNRIECQCPGFIQKDFK